MLATDHNCQILLYVFIDSSLYVSYFLTDNVVIQLTPVGAGIWPPFIIGIWPSSNAPVPSVMAI